MYVYPKVIEHGWNKTSAYCYKIGCTCRKCDLLLYYEFLQAKCRMKHVVMELVRTYGAPETKYGNEE